MSATAGSTGRNGCFLCQHLQTALVWQRGDGWHELLSPTNYLFGQRSNTLWQKLCTMFMQVWAFNIPKKASREEQGQRNRQKQKHQYVVTTSIRYFKHYSQMLYFLIIFQCMYVINKWQPQAFLVFSTEDYIYLCRPVIQSPMTDTYCYLIRILFTVDIRFKIWGCISQNMYSACISFSLWSKGWGCVRCRNLQCFYQTVFLYHQLAGQSPE